MSRTIDLHHHVMLDFYWEAYDEDGNAAGGINPPHWRERARRRPADDRAPLVVGELAGALQPPSWPPRPADG